MVHGGASLQEVVIPVIEINKEKKEAISSTWTLIFLGGQKTLQAINLAQLLFKRQPMQTRCSRVN